MNSGTPIPQRDSVFRHPEKAPNAWWREFDRALAQALDNGASAKKAEDWALYAAETKHPGGRDARN